MRNNRLTGKIYETKAALYLMQSGFEIKQYNFCCQYGEIDLIAQRQDHLLLFVEVKYRSSLSYGYPQEAVCVRKQRTIRRVAAYYLAHVYGNREVSCRFDVIAIYKEQIKWIPNAF